MKPILTIAVTLVLTMSAAAQIIIPANTVIPVRCTEAIDSRHVTVGQEIVLVVPMDIQIGGETVIRAGAPVASMVASAKGTQMAGISGAIGLNLRSTVAVDGTTVPLDGQMLNSGDSEVGATVATGAILCPLALLNKGKPGMIVPGAETRAMSIGEIAVDPSQPAEIGYLPVDFVPMEEEESHREKDREF